MLSAEEIKAIYNRWTAVYDASLWSFYLLGFKVRDRVEIWITYRKSWTKGPFIRFDLSYSMINAKNSSFFSD